jgi:hypothetical protein
MKSAASRHSKLGLARIGVVLVLVASGCYSDIHGARQAPRMGDTSHLAPRIPYGFGAQSDVAHACAAVYDSSGDPSDVVRAPYLQGVTTTEAYVVWTARSIGVATLLSPANDRLASQGATSDPSSKLVTGGGGRSTRRVHTRSFTGFDLGVLHFLYVEAGNAQMVVHAIDATGVEFDSEVIPLTHG